LYAITNHQPPSSALALKINNVFINMDETKQLTELFQGHESLSNTISGRYHQREHQAVAMMSITTNVVSVGQNFSDECRIFSFG